ncbi:hypothetical protein EVAR_15944_1 [Eumeta japonica]|uniref:Uncharacterized protein n=1 Tax=Eumeta variegata TaxID=151549 RepID=A0A4C1UL42_EUMVA|nr:hypothetical protein EVAR_15944_1 [Eumeta japonica]
MDTRDMCATRWQNPAILQVDIAAGSCASILVSQVPAATSPTTRVRIKKLGAGGRSTPRRYRVTVSTVRVARRVAGTLRVFEGSHNALSSFRLHYNTMLTFQQENLEAL